MTNWHKGKLGTVAEDLVGRKFGRLLVLGRAGQLSNQAAWECWCDCGVVEVKTRQALRTAKAAACSKCKRWDELEKWVSDQETLSRFAKERNIGKGFRMLGRIDAKTITVQCTRCLKITDRKTNTLNVDAAGCRECYKTLPRAKRLPREQTTKQVETTTMYKLYYTDLRYFSTLQFNTIEAARLYADKTGNKFNIVEAK
jgi:hypothetical protein